MITVAASVIGFGLGVAAASAWSWWRRDRPAAWVTQGDARAIPLDFRITAHPDTAIQSIESQIDALHPDDRVMVWVDITLSQGWTEGNAIRPKPWSLTHERNFKWGPFHGSPEQVKDAIRHALMDSDSPLVVWLNPNWHGCPLPPQTPASHPTIAQRPKSRSKGHNTDAERRLFWRDSDSPVLMRVHGLAARTAAPDAVPAASPVINTEAAAAIREVDALLSRGRPKQTQ